MIVTVDGIKKRLTNKVYYYLTLDMLKTKLTREKEIVLVDKFEVVLSNFSRTSGVTVLMLEALNLSHKLRYSHSAESSI